MDYDYLDPVKSVYAVPYRSTRRFFIVLACMSSAYVCGVGPSALIDNFAGIPVSAITCIWTGPIADLTIPFTFFAFLYVIFTERPLLLIVAISMILVYSHCARPGWWMAIFWALVAVGAGCYLLYRWVRKAYELQGA